jgi:hypothetical protein
MEPSFSTDRILYFNPTSKTGYKQCEKFKALWKFFDLLLKWRIGWDYRNKYKKNQLVKKIRLRHVIPNYCKGEIVYIGHWLICNKDQKWPDTIYCGVFIFKKLEFWI